MKKLILSLAISTIGFAAAYAQKTDDRVRRKKPTMSVEQRAEKSTQKLENDLNLTADQKQKIHKIHLERAEKLQASQKKHREYVSQFRKEQMQLSKTTNDKILNILDSEQKTKYAESKKGNKRFSKSQFKNLKSDSLKRYKSPPQKF